MKKIATLLFSVSALVAWATNHQVTVGNNFFNPQNLTINVGDTVTWNNTAGFHNVNGSQTTYPNNPVSFGNGAASSTLWTYSFTFTVAGTYDYQCDPHVGVGMTGTITVAAATPVYNIADVTGVDANGVADSNGVDCALAGVVLTDTDLRGGNGYQFAIHDGTAGITVFSFSDVDGYSVSIGDSLYIEGTIAQFNGLTQIQPDSIYVIATGATVKMPTVVTALGESTENDLIRINGVTLVNASQWPSSGSTNVDITNGTDTMTIRIDSDTDIDGTPAPAGTFDIIGIGGQFDGSSPYLSGYQILPRSTADIISQSNFNTYSIASVTTVDANGVADSLNAPANLLGTVTSIDFRGGNGYQFAIHDGTGGIHVFDFSDVNGYVVNIGDSIYVEGDIDQFNGLTQIRPDSISIVSTGNTVKMPTVVNALGESTESDLIRINGVTLVNASQWPSSGSANVDITNGTDTMTMRIDSDTDIDGSPAPTGTFDVVGIGSQFDGSSPYLSGYQILPRALTDIIPAGAGTGCSEIFFSEYIEGSSNDKALEVYNPSNSAINLSGYSIVLFSNGNTTPGNTFNFPNINLASGDVYVIANPSASTAIASVADTTSSVTFFNGDDALVLFKNADTLDIIGEVGVDPGSSWPVGSGSTQNHTLVRQLAVDAGTTDWSVSSSQWDVYPSGTSTFLGAHSSSCQGGTPSGTPEYAIADITGVDTNGVADSLNVYCIIRGIVSGGNLRSSGVEFWLIDSVNSDGLLVRNTSYQFYTTTEGDELWVRGTVDQFNGLIQFVPDSIHVLSSGNALPAPAATTVLDESTEGRYIVMNNMTILSGWPNPGSSGNVTISDGVNNFTMRIDSDTHISDSITTPPTGLVNIYGHGGQFDSSSPFDGGYQINPRYDTDIEPVIVTTPTINFPAPAQTVTESVGTITITMPINPVSANAETVKLYLVEGAGITSGDYSTSPAAVNDTITLSVTAGDSATFDVTINDDILQENDETLTFSIASVTAGLTVGPIATHVLTISDNDVFIPTYAIPDLKGLDANFLPDSLGVQCKIVGTVLGVDMQGVASSNISFTVHDGTVGFGVFSSSASYVVQEGDQVRVIGTVGHFNGLAQINADSVAFISANNPLPTPTVITALGEVTESDLIRFNNAEVIDPTQWTNAGSGFNVDITNGVDTIVLRVDRDVTDVYAAPAPVGTFDVVGIGGQFDNSDPRDEGYQMLPRYLADFIFPTPPNYPIAVTEIMPGSNDPNGNVNEDWWELTNYGTVSIDLSGFSWDDDSENPGTVVFPNITINPGESFVIWNGVSANEADFEATWGLSNVTIISSDETTGSHPGLSQGGDAVVLYDTSMVPVEICNAIYPSATAGFSVEFDTTCIFLGNAVNGQNGAYTSTGGDVGSPGNVAPNFGLEEFNSVGINVYPNPTQNILNLELPSGEKSIRLISITGATVLETNTALLIDQLDISELPGGVYMMHISWYGKQAVGRIVKQ
jgi:plastocyanin/DNA/RNA endonuclease YhcR with UshA esterase domain